MRIDGGRGAAWQAQNNCQRQRDRNYQYGGAQMVSGNANRLALHRTQKADADRLCGKFQRQIPGCALERNPVLVTSRGPREDRDPEGRLQ